MNLLDKEYKMVDKVAISRRRFIKSSILAGAGLLIPRPSDGARVSAPREVERGIGLDTGGRMQPSQDLGQVPLGIGIYDVDNVAFFNEYARDQDVISARPPFLYLLENVQVGRKMLNFNPRDEPLEDLGPTVWEAKELGVTLLGYNLETALEESELIEKEIRMRALAERAGLTYAFGPTIVKLMRYYDDFALHADALVLQSQNFQTLDGYQAIVEGLIARIKAVSPQVEVWVQVSVNPPEDRNMTPEEVIGDIQLVAHRADLIWIYFGQTTVSVMEEVFRALRS